MADVRVLFDQVADDYPVMVSHLRPTAKIVHTPVFESALVKICNNTKLTASELRAVQRFVVEPTATSGKRKERAASNYASEILRGGKQMRTAGAATVSFHELAKVWTCMLPANFEMLAFLRVNRDLWNAASLITTE
ncbi:hypothetical protein F442_13122 [Phytophthora nicotianae P10297]|uniref:HAT C-terminal dimerisation domain-containing protein n=1 Tax=Phytophthora nicotianae P10297 TaxID=1317064 RepID=W2YX77_PHYNI|nr:hypothetical protein F442_13122 [Phytophthora nicotianae P10297]